jgi:hypothetical protein
VVLDVLCSDMELGEYGEVIAVGDAVRRLGVRRRTEWFGTGLDQIEYWFDRYAGLVGTGEIVVLSGEIDAIASVYTRVTRLPDGAWGPRPGSASLEPLASTIDTRRPLRYIAPTAGPPSISQGGAWGRWDPREGDESLWGWRVTLADVDIEAADHVS